MILRALFRGCDVSWVRTKLDRIHTSVLGNGIALTNIARTLKRLDNLIMALREEFNQDLADLGTAITELASRIDQLPQDADDITQEDLDQLRSAVSRVNTLAVNSDDVPTGNTGDSGENTPGQNVPDQV